MGGDVHAVTLVTRASRVDVKHQAKVKYHISHVGLVTELLRFLGLLLDRHAVRICILRFILCIDVDGVCARVCFCTSSSMTKCSFSYQSGLF